MSKRQPACRLVADRAVQICVLALAAIGLGLIAWQALEAWFSP